jgi:hypothetical protein
VQENIRQETLIALAELAMADPRFVVDVFDDPDADLNAKLARYGFSLNEEELEGLESFGDVFLAVTRESQKCCVIQEWFTLSGGDTSSYAIKVR